MEELKKRFPSDIDYNIAIDTTKAVTEGIREIGMTFWEALALVMLVVFIFLQGWRAALIPLARFRCRSSELSRCFRPWVSRSTLCPSSVWFSLSGWWWTTPSSVVEAVEHHIGEGMSPRTPR